MIISNRYNYEIYIFDLDGTIIDSEKQHYEAYNLQLKNKLTFDEYCKIFHSNDKSKFCKINNINKAQKESDFKKIYSKNPKYIDGFEIFFKELILHGKTTCIVTKSSKERCDFIRSLHPLLNNIDIWITSDDVKRSKPNPEGYIKALNKFINIHDLNKIAIFEDSYTGFLSLEHIYNVNKYFIVNKDYTYYDVISKNNICLNNYEEFKENNKFITNHNNGLTDFSSIFSKYNHSFNLIYKYSEFLIPIILPLLINKNIFILGVGKSGLIAQKCVSTWNSLGISAYTNNITDLFHGDFGKIKDDDVIIHISNSGNTEELINVAKHLKNNFNVTQISLSNNKNNKMKDFCDYNFEILNGEKINEIDNNNKAPTTSSAIFLLFLDTLGIQLRNILGTFEINDFKRFHPGGTLGKNNLIDAVVLVACGKGTRLYPYTKHMPKNLVNLDDDSLLCKQLQYWSKYTEKFIILIEEKYNELIKFYCNEMKVNYDIRNVLIDNKQENSYTIQKGLGNIVDNQNIIIVWCDILLTNNIDVKLLDENTIFTYGNQCRYLAENNTLTKVNDDGNVIGCYYIKNYKKIENDNDKNDFCDVFLKNFKNFKTYNLDNLIDIGDLNKLKEYRNTNNDKYITRFFNKIVNFSDNYLKKCSLNEKGVTLMENEIKYYKMVSIIDKQLPFPKIKEFGKDYFIMEKIEGNALWEIDNNKDYLIDIFKNLNTLHNTYKKSVNKNDFDSNLKYEFFDKIINRCNAIKPLINYFDVTSINGVEIVDSFETILNSLFNDIKLYYENTEKIYNIIHGDCQFSNTLKNKDDKIVFIDPRAYFGKSKFFGIKEYDYSKVLYALSGYDKFNNTNDYYFNYNPETKNIDLLINDTDLTKYETIFENNNIDFYLCIKMVIIHWFGLAEYNKNNFLKCIGSYYNGFYLYHKFLKNTKN
jgi:D-arabinose 5-phosphate isomerase GutQ/beta-phosphoglucomutase-like phosphatase (HAD superfamily)